MPSTYTTNGGIEKIATGEQSGSWGDTTNTNFDILDRITNGVGSIALSGTSSNLQTSDGVLSDGQFKVLILGGSPSGTHTITVLPNDAQKLYFVQNSTGQSVVFSQGSGGNVTVAAGKNEIFYCDGAGAGAAVVSLLNALELPSYLETANNLSDLDNAASALINLGINSTSSELNILSGVTVTSAELNYNDITTLGTSQASKVVTADSNGDVYISEELKAKSYHDTFSNIVSSGGTTTVNCETANVFSTTLSQNTTLSITNPPTTGTAYGFMLKIAQDSGGSGYTFTWPASVVWQNASAPNLSTGADQVDQFVLYTHDGGSTFYAFLAGKNMG